MTDAPARDTHARVRTREQLLHVLHDDPRSVSREEIKAAFADGRLGDQDLDIPVLAGMRRITELLADLHPDDAAAHEAGVVSEAAASNSVARPAGMSVRLTGLEERIGHLEAAATEPAPPSPTVQDVADLRATLTRLEASLAERDTRWHQVMLLAVAALVIAIAAVILAVLVH
jgi:hypothetical protein